MFWENAHLLTSFLTFDVLEGRRQSENFDLVSHGQARTGKDKLLARILITSILYRIQLGHLTIIMSEDY